MCLRPDKGPRVYSKIIRARNVSKESKRWGCIEKW